MELRLAPGLLLFTCLLVTGARAAVAPAPNAAVHAIRPANTSAPAEIVAEELGVIDF